MKCLFFLLVFRLILAQSNKNDETQLSSDMDKRLFDYLFKNYNKVIPPHHNSTHPLVVRVRLSAVLLKSIDFAEQTLSMDTFLNHRWDDPRLKWPPKISKSNRIRVDANSLWTPDVTILNSADANMIEIAERSNTKRVMLYQPGVPVWTRQQSLKVLCSLDITYYPFDTHNCSIIVGSLRSDIDFRLYDNEEKINENPLWEIPEWEVLDTYAKRTTDNNNVYLTFSLKIGRARPLYQVIVLFPLAAGIILAITAFLISPFEDKRIGFNVFVLFLFIFIMLQLIEILPSVGQHIPAVVSICEALIVLVTLSIVWNIILQLISGYLFKKKLSPLAQKFLSSRPIMFINRQNLDYTRQMDPNEIKVNEEQEAIRMKQRGWRNQWQPFLIVLDKLTFVIFIFLVVVILIAFCS